VGNVALDALWAKKSRTGELRWLPLCVHLSDTTEVARLLWDRHIPDGVKSRIASLCGCDEVKSRALFVFLAAVHDLGKATPSFQEIKAWLENRDLDERITNRLRLAGYESKRIPCPKETPHALCSQVLLEQRFKRAVLST
jgi:CRISPR-associated endonuclease/helicase Cas3